MTSGVYAIVNMITGKAYIGSSVHVPTRITQHRYSLNRNQHRNRHLQRAWNLYGPSSFVLEIIREVEPSKLVECEQFYLENTAETYNINRDTSRPPSQKGAKRKPTSDETKAKISASLVGRTHSAERIAKSSAARLGKWHQSESMRLSISGDRNWMRKNPDKVLRGEQCFWTKLSDADVIAIRELRGTLSGAQLAERFGISESYANSVARGVWRRVVKNA